MYMRASCLTFCKCAWWCPMKVSRMVASHGTGVADGCETPCGAGNLAQVL